MAALTHSPARCVRPLCGGVYETDSDGWRNCILCGRSAPPLPPKPVAVTPCRIRACRTCLELQASGYPPRRAVRSCPHSRSGKSAPHCADVCTAARRRAQYLKKCRRRGKRTPRAKTPGLPRNGRCAAVNCVPRQNARRLGQAPAPALECAHACQGLAPHCRAECERQYRLTRAQNARYRAIVGLA